MGKFKNKLISILAICLCVLSLSFADAGEKKGQYRLVNDCVGMFSEEAIRDSEVRMNDLNRFANVSVVTYFMKNEDIMARGGMDTYKDYLYSRSHLGSTLGKDDILLVIDVDTHDISYKLSDNARLDAEAIDEIVNNSLVYETDDEAIYDFTTAMCDKTMEEYSDVVARNERAIEDVARENQMAIENQKTSKKSKAKSIFFSTIIVLIIGVFMYKFGTFMGNKFDRRKMQVKIIDR